jgi:hypothetical protein
MADKEPKSDEVVADLARLQLRAKELFAEHNRVNQELLDVIKKIDSLTSQKTTPTVAPGALDRR